MTDPEPGCTEEDLRRIASRLANAVFDEPWGKVIPSLCYLLGVMIARHTPEATAEHLVAARGMMEGATESALKHNQQRAARKADGWAAKRTS